VPRTGDGTTWVIPTPRATEPPASVNKSGPLITEMLKICAPLSCRRYSRTKAAAGRITAIITMACGAPLPMLATALATSSLPFS